MTRRARLALFAIGAAGLAALFTAAVVDLPGFGHYAGPYGDVLNRVAVGERHATSVIGAVVYDYRGLDTMVEELILFASVLGTALLLREHREGRARDDDPVRSEAFRFFGLLSVPAVLLIAFVVVAYGYVAPGGGFQGGVVAASSALLVWGAGSYAAFRCVTPQALVELAEAAAALGFVLIGVAGIVAGGAAFENFLPLGTPATLLSAGQIPLLNWAAGLEVAAALTLLFAEFLEDVMIHEGNEP
jgi:multicomponent Na+:H+ antiporter subunit B